jgi:predicted Zn-dependent peptidase
MTKMGCALSLGLLLILPPAPYAGLDVSTVQEHRLANGMQVLLWHDATIPNVAMYIFYRVGSRNEAPGITGLAHFF